MRSADLILTIGLLAGTVAAMESKQIQHKKDKPSPNSDIAAVKNSKDFFGDM